MSAYGTEGIVILMMDCNNSIDTTGDAVLCVQIIQLSTLYTHQLVTVRGLQNQIVNHARVHCVEEEHDRGGLDIRCSIHGCISNILFDFLLVHI